MINHFKTKKTRKCQSYKLSGGFTLMGVIFAIGITVTALVGILGLLRYVIVAGRFSQDRFIAANLASEGIEIVRAIRDTNWKLIRPWNYSFPVPAEGAREFLVDYRQTALLAWADEFLRIDGGGYYGYDNGQATKFKRTITLDPASAACNIDECIGVFSRVTWGSSSMVLEDRLYNWKP
jgi:hypothetical protein